MKYFRVGSKITVLFKFYYLLHIAQVSPWLHKIMLSVFRNDSASDVGLEVGLLTMEATWRSVVWLMCVGVSVEHVAPIIRVNVSVLCFRDVRFELYLAH
jgi:hypothetical protein